MKNRILAAAPKGPDSRSSAYVAAKRVAPRMIAAAEKRIDHSIWKDLVRVRGYKIRICVLEKLI